MKAFFCLLLLAFGAAIAPVAGQQPAASPPAAAEPKRPAVVPADAKFFNGRWYRVYLEKGGWTHAKNKCSNLGGRLVIIPDADVQQFVAELSEGFFLWLGATDHKIEGIWFWIDQNRMKYSAWEPGQPQNAPGENCLAMWHGRWHDAFEGEPGSQGFICEWPAK